MTGQPPPGVPAILRTGFGDNATPNTHSASLLRKTVAMTFALVSRAARHAATYASHAHRNEVTNTDVQMGLRYSARHFFDEEGFDQVEKEVHEISAMLEKDESGSDDDDSSFDSDEEGDTCSESTDDDDANEEDETDEAMTETQTETDRTNMEMDTEAPAADAAQPWSRSECECSVCAGMHHTESTWDAWMPEDPIEMFLKTHADRAINHASS